MRASSDRRSTGRILGAARYLTWWTVAASSMSSRLLAIDRLAASTHLATEAGDADDGEAAVATGRGRDRPTHQHLSVMDICAELNIARSTFYDWRAKKTAPPCIKLPNGELRVRRSDFEAWLDSRSEHDQ
jgi:predicted DNA-binding transcriptional regulator AlpA